MMTREKLKVVKVHVEGEEFSQIRYVYSRDGVDVMATLEKSFPQPNDAPASGATPRKRGKGKRQPKSRAPAKAG